LEEELLSDNKATTVVQLAVWAVIIIVVVLMCLSAIVGVYIGLRRQREHSVSAQKLTVAKKAFDARLSLGERCTKEQKPLPLNTLEITLREAAAHQKLIDQPSPMTALERSASQRRQLLGTSAYFPAISRAANSPASTKVVEAVESPAATNTSVVLHSTSSSSSSYPNLQSSNLKSPVLLVDPDAQLSYSVEELNVGLDMQEQTSHADTTGSGKSSNRQARKGGRKSTISRYTSPRTPSKDGPKTIKRRPLAGGRSLAGLAQ